MNLNLYKFTSRKLSIKLFLWVIHKWWMLGFFLFFIGVVINYFSDNVVSSVYEKKVQNDIYTSDNEFKNGVKLWLDLKVDKLPYDVDYFEDVFNGLDVKILFYENSTCKFWSEAPLLPENIISDIQPNDTIFSHFGRIIYTRVAKSDNRKVVLIATLTHFSEFSNRFYELNRSYDIVNNSRYLISLDCEGDNVIKNSEGKSLFSIELKPNSFQFYIGAIFIWLGIFMIVLGGLMTIFRANRGQRLVVVVISSFIGLTLSRMFLYYLDVGSQMGAIFDSNDPINYELIRNFKFRISLADILIDTSLLYIFFVSMMCVRKRLNVFFSKNRNQLKKNLFLTIYTLIRVTIFVFLSFAGLSVLFVVFSYKTPFEYFSFDTFSIVAFMIFCNIFAIAYMVVNCVTIFYSSKFHYLFEFLVILLMVLTANSFGALFHGSGLFITIAVIISSMSIVLRISFNNGYGYILYIMFISFLSCSIVFFDNGDTKDYRHAELAKYIYNSKLDNNTFYAYVSQKEKSTVKMASSISFVKISNGKIMDSYGEYVCGDTFENESFPEGFCDRNNSRHYTIKSKTDNYMVIVSRPIRGVTDFLSFFTYIFILYVIGEFLLIGTWFFFSDVSLYNRSIYIKLRLTVIFIFVIATLLVVFFILRYFKIANRINDTSVLISKSQRICDDFIHSYANKPISVCDYSAFLSDRELVEDVNVNLYDNNGRFVSSSFNGDEFGIFVPKLIDYKAVNNLDNTKVSFFILRRQFGTAAYSSYYTKIPLIGGDSIYLQIIGMDNYQKGVEDTLLSNVINIFIIISICVFLLIIFFYKEGMKPLSLLIDSLSNMKYHKRIDSTMYKRGSELDALIDMYNNAVEELEATLMKLAEKGREEAWRVVAQQVAHELKNPLTPIKLKVQMILYRKKMGDVNWDKGIEDDLNLIITQVDILAKIISQFSAVNSLSSSVRDYCDLDKLLVDIKEFYSGYSNITVSYLNRSDFPVTLYVNRDNMWSVVTNLMVNAIAAIGDNDDGLININLSTVEGNAIISVEDNGGGIKDQHKDMVFKPNFTTKKAGSGIGLTIASGIVKNMGGRIFFTSVYEIGTTFFIEVPYCTSQENNN